MPAINGVKKKSTSLKRNQGSTSGLSVFIAVVITAIVTLGVVFGLWKFVLQEKVYNSFVSETSNTEASVYVATRDILPGESIADAISLEQVPTNVAVSDALVMGSEITDLRASRTILARGIVTSTNTYDPATQDTVLTSSRFLTVGGLDSTNIDVGDYVDIRLEKSRNSGSSTSYEDWIVVAKKEILGKGVDGSLIMMLSESEIMNLNNAVLEAQAANMSELQEAADVYLAKYVDPVNQPKAKVTYTGAGSKYTQAELEEAQERIANITNGEEEYEHPEPISSVGMDTSASSSSDDENTTDSGEENAE